MLIESRIKPVAPKPYRTITLFGQTYDFKPLLPDRFVAEVTNRKHIETFLANPAYSEFKDTLPGATLQRSPAPAIGGTVPATPQPPAPITETTKDALPEGGETDAGDEGEGDGEDAEGDDNGAPADAGTWPTAIADEAATLLRLSPDKLAVAVSKVTTKDVLSCALALEKNKTGRQKPRDAVIGLLEATLRDIAAAGV
ncbi:MAG: hypothetical protein ACRC2H_07510 [Silanimonas sp.]